jgi:hypothetical protein
MKIDEVRRRAFAMPLTSPAFPPRPYRFINREYLIITYRTDPAALEKASHVAPAPLFLVFDRPELDLARDVSPQDQRRSAMIKYILSTAVLSLGLVSAAWALPSMSGPQIQTKLSDIVKVRKDFDEDRDRDRHGDRDRFAEERYRGWHHYAYALTIGKIAAASL